MENNSLVLNIFSAFFQIFLSPNPWEDFLWFTTFFLLLLLEQPHVLRSGLVEAQGPTYTTQQHPAFLISALVCHPSSLTAVVYNRERLSLERRIHNNLWKNSFFSHVKKKACERYLKLSNADFFFGNAMQTYLLKHLMANCNKEAFVNVMRIFDRNHCGIFTLSMWPHIICMCGSSVS